MSEVLQVEARTEFGSRSSQKLRAAGSIPGNVYGQGTKSKSVTIANDQFRALLRAEKKTVTLAGGATGTVCFQEIQWDTFWREVLHVDMLLISDAEAAEINS